MPGVFGGDTVSSYYSKWDRICQDWDSDATSASSQVEEQPEPEIEVEPNIKGSLQQPIVQPDSTSEAKPEDVVQEDIEVLEPDPDAQDDIEVLEPDPDTRDIEVQPDSDAQEDVGVLEPDPDMQEASHTPGVPDSEGHAAISYSETPKDVDEAPHIPSPEELPKVDHIEILEPDPDAQEDTETVKPGSPEQDPRDAGGTTNDPIVLESSASPEENPTPPTQENICGATEADLEGRSPEITETPIQPPTQVEPVEKKQNPPNSQKAKAAKKTGSWRVGSTVEVKSYKTGQWLRAKVLSTAAEFYSLQLTSGAVIRRIATKRIRTASMRASRI